MARKLTSKSSTSSKWSSSSTSSRSSSYLEENRKSSPSRLLRLKSELDNDGFVSTIITGPAASPRVQKYIKYDDWKGHPRAFFNMEADLTYEGCIFFQQRLVLAALSGKPVKLKNLRAVEDDPGLKGVSTIELILEITAFSAAYFSYI